MPRPCCQRLIAGEPTVSLFKPAGVPATELETRVLALDEVEALRLADMEGLYHDGAAAQMGVSRATFGRIVGEARRKVAEALIGGHALRLQGGNVTVEGNETMRDDNEAQGGRCRRRHHRHRAHEQDAGSRRQRGCGGNHGSGRRRGLGKTARGQRGEAES